MKFSDKMHPCTISEKLIFMRTKGVTQSHVNRKLLFQRFFFYLDADCKRTPEGIEYLGQTNTTSDGKGCQSWENALSTSLPYGSHKSNVNYCRTATRLAHQQMNFMGMPWCYDIEGTPQACNITYCGKTLGPVSISEKTSFRKIS